MSRPGFQAAANLRDALANAFGSAPLSPEEMKTTLAGLRENPSAGGALLQRMIRVLASKEVDAAIFAVLEWATYQPKGLNELAAIKVNKALFDDPEHGDAAREDFYKIAFAAAEVAVKPFLGGLLSTFMAFLKKPVDGLESKSSSPPSAS
jgi:hypothetical protein